MILSLTFLILIPGVLAITLVEHEKALNKHIEKYLTRNSPPEVFNKTVYCVLDLYQILSVEEKNNIVNLKLWITCFYDILQMAWKPENYGGIKTMTFQKDTFWIPDLDIPSMLKKEYESSTLQSVYYYGSVTSIATLVNAKVSCQIDVTKFPHDQHACELPLRQVTNDVSDFRMKFPPFATEGKPQMDLAFYTKHDQWELIEPVLLYVHPPTDHDSKDLHIYLIRIRRVPEFFNRILIYPTLVLFILSTLSFYLPFESGEKVGFSITILLAQIVSLLVLSDTVPSSSLHFPVFGTFVLINIFFVGFTLVESVITLNLYYKGISNSPPLCLRKLLYTRIVWLVGTTRLTRSSIIANDTAKLEANHEGRNDSIPKNDSIVQKVQQLEEMACVGDNDDQIEKEWQMIALIIDRCCGYIYIISGIAAIIYYDPLQLSDANF